MPLRNQIHVDTLLGNLSVKYTDPELIAMQVFPRVPVKKDSDLYRVYDRNFRIPETNRANKGVAREHDFDVSTASYTLQKHALKNYISDDDADNYDLADLRAEMTTELTAVVMRRLEKSVSDLFTTTNWSLNVSLSAAQAFNANTTVSNPIPVFDTGASTVIANSGKMPNFGIMNREAFVACKNHISVLDRTKYVSADMDVAILQGLLGLEKLHISLASVDTAALGQASSISALWGNVAFLGWKPNSPGPLTPSCGYIFMKDKSLVKRWRDEERESEAIEVNISYDPHVVASLAGYLIKAVT